jgi:16S rRNA (cytosine967-C5)-methyltransferase
MAQPARSGQPRSGQSRDGQSRDGQSRDGQPRSGRSKPGAPRAGQSRASQPRSGQPRSGQPRSGQGGGPRRQVDPARRVAYDVLRAVAERDAYANLLLPALLTERGLAGRDAAFATELTYGTLRGRGTYDAILAACSDRDQLDPPVRDVLRLGAHQLLATRVGAHAAVATSVDLTKDVCGPRPSGFVNAVLRRVATRDLDTWTELIAPSRDRDPVGYLAVRCSYPPWIIEAISDALGDASAAELEDALAAGNLRPDVTLALTPGPAGRQLPAPAGATPTRWSPYGLRLAGGDPAPYVTSGQAVVQDEASQLAALALARVSLAPPPGAGPAPEGPDQAADGLDRLWLDLCAGPGGKARMLAGLAAQRGARLVASDVRPHRAGQVQAALSRASDHAAGTQAVLAADGLRVPWQAGTFDRVLADVPCSNLGSLRRRPEARWRKTPDGVAELAAVQRGLLTAAIESARPGGVIAYVTCSPHLAETRDVVLDVVAGRDDVTILDAPAVLPEVPGLAATDPRFAQFWPHRHGTDGIFLALIARRSPPGRFRRP